MSLAPSLQLTNLGNKFTVHSFFPYLRLTVKIFQFLRLSTKFLAVYAYRLTPLRPSFTRFAKKRTSRDMWSSWNYFRNNNGQPRYKGRNKERYKKIKWRNTWCSFFVRTNLILEISVSSLRLSKTKDSFQGRLDSNVQSTMSGMARELIWNKPSNHWRPKAGICTISINCPFMTRCQKKKISGKIDIAYW